MREAIDRLGLCILGLGLMGGSLARAARARIPGVRIAGWNRSAASREQAQRAGVFDLISGDVAEALAGADVVVLCVPVLAATELMREYVGVIGGGAVVTDVGSTKHEICASLVPMLADAGCRFVGSHPICGGELSGFDASSPDLYDGAVVVVTPGSRAPSDGVGRVTELWRQVGARVVELGAAEHDILLARTSHLPHVAAAALVRAAAREAIPGLGLSGTGLVDTTRVASGPEDVWHDILKSNAAAVVPEVRAMAAELEKVADALGNGDFDGVRRWLAEARTMRKDLLAAREDLLADTPERGL